MSKKFDELIHEALQVEREIRSLSGDKPSLRCFIAECLARADASYDEVEAVKERLAEKLFGLHSGCGAYIRNVTREIASGRLPEPPVKKRIGGLYWNQKDQAVVELGGHAEKLFLLWVVAAELAHQENPGVFGTVEDIEKHKARLAELEKKRGELHKKIPTGWSNDDVIIGRIGSDFAALISWRRAPDIAVGMGPEALIDELLDGGEANEGRVMAGIAQKRRAADRRNTKEERKRARREKKGTATQKQVTVSEAKRVT
jgi:hypothetical protein